MSSSLENPHSLEFFGAFGVSEYLIFFFPEAKTGPAVFLPEPFVQFSCYLTVEAFSIG